MIRSRPSLASLDRRQLLRCALVLGGAAGLHELAAAGDWMPYPPDQVTVIAPTLTQAMPGRTMPDSGRVATLRINPVITDLQGSAPLTRALTQPRTVSLPPLRGEPPRAYVRVGRSTKVAPWLLFGVALQESRLKFGQRTLPYPWTLCVRGRGLRYANYDATLAALKGYVGRGVTNVDCGAMQVNWHWHSTRLGSFERALDPYPNLLAGARILREHYERERDWHRAVALYHTGSWDTVAKRNRGTRYANQTFSRLTRLGLTAAHVQGESRHG